MTLSILVPDHSRYSNRGLVMKTDSLSTEFCIFKLASPVRSDPG